MCAHPHLPARRRAHWRRSLSSTALPATCPSRSVPQSPLQVHARPAPLRPRSPAQPPPPRRRHLPKPPQGHTPPPPPPRCPCPFGALHPPAPPRAQHRSSGPRSGSADRGTRPCRPRSRHRCASTAAPAGLPRACSAGCAASPARCTACRALSGARAPAWARRSGRGQGRRPRAMARHWLRLSAGSRQQGSGGCRLARESSTRQRRGRMPRAASAPAAPQSTGAAPRSEPHARAAPRAAPPPLPLPTESARPAARLAPLPAARRAPPRGPARGWRPQSAHAASAPR
mmetsp:Transcript_17979/g.58824  ORF Transcript_17979/g.58824 Transcript_17979/m.58824 type:complete len:286 (-) Transcript_17979:915-1772(-)